MKKLIVIIFIVLCGAPLSALADDTMGSCTRAGAGAFQTTQTNCSAAGGKWTANSSNTTCPAGQTLYQQGNVSYCQGSSVGDVSTPTTATPAASQTNSSASTPCGSNCNLKYTPLEPLPNVNYDTITGSGGLSSLVNTAFTILIVIGALMAVLMLTIGGFQYMISTSLPNKQQGLKRTQAAIWGIVLIAAIWLILHTINPALLNISLTPCPDGVNCTVTGKTSTATQATPSANTGVVQTIQASDGNAAITKIQNNPTDVTQADAQAANNDLNTDESTCTNTYHGDVGGGVMGDNTGCTNDASFSYGGKTYNKCANIPLPTGGDFACYYNQ